MDATLTHIDTFNQNLARAKLAALQLLQDIMASLSDPDPPIPKRFRELRLIAGAILRTQPMKPIVTPARTEPPPAAPSSPSPPSLCPSAPSPVSPSPKPRRFHPSSEWARAAARSLIKGGHLPKDFLDDLPPDSAADPPRPLSARSPP